MIALALVAGSALAADTPHLWVREFSAIALRPSGVIVDVATEARIPVLRFGGVIFNDTFAGAGARFAVSPAHMDLAARASFKPMDILPITVEGVYTTYWESPWGVYGRDEVPGQLGRDRRPAYEADIDYAAHALALTISPTLQLKVGPVAGFTNIATTFLRVRPAPDANPYVWEPYRGMVVAPDDRILEHTSALLWDPFDGNDTPIFRLGGVIRGRTGHETGDTTLMAGGITQWRPGRNPHDADFTLLVAPYLQDPDFRVGSPYLALLVSFQRVVPFTRIDRD